MSTNLNVPFSDKDEAKRLGARWNPKKKVWYVPGETDLVPFLKWIPAERLARDGPKVTGSGFKILCECEVLPWEDCIHTDKEYVDEEDIFFVRIE